MAIKNMKTEMTMEDIQSMLNHLGDTMVSIIGPEEGSPFEQALGRVVDDIASVVDAAGENRLALLTNYTHDDNGYYVGLPESEDSQNLTISMKIKRGPLAYNITLAIKDPV